MNLDPETLQNILKINGLSPDSPPDQIKALLAKGNYSSAEVDAALAALHGEVPIPPAYSNSSTSMPSAAVQYSEVKPLKSTFWIWMTLWLMTVFDSFLILVVCALLVIIFIIKQTVFTNISPTVLMVLTVLIGAVAISIGSYAASTHVLKRARIMKSDAGKYAGLAVIVPVVGSLLILGLFIYFNRGNMNPANITSIIGKQIIFLSLMYVIIRSQLEKKGE